MNASPRLTLYGRTGCHLCERMRAELAPLAAELGLAVEEVDIGGDPGLGARYGELCHYFLEPAAVRAHFSQIR
jgi:diaminopimelate decarboxylase